MNRRESRDLTSESLMVRCPSSWFNFIAYFFTFYATHLSHQVLQSLTQSTAKSGIRCTTVRSINNTKNFKRLLFCQVVFVHWRGKLHKHKLCTLSVLVKDRKEKERGRQRREKEGECQLHLLMSTHTQLILKDYPLPLLPPALFPPSTTWMSDSD